LDVSWGEEGRVFLGYIVKDACCLCTLIKQTHLIQKKKKKKKKKKKTRKKQEKNKKKTRKKQEKNGHSSYTFFVQIVPPIALYFLREFFLFFPTLTWF